MKVESILGRRLSDLLEQRGITQRELAEKVGVTEVSMSRYINGGRTPQAHILANIAKELNTTSAYLLGQDSEDTEPEKPITEDITRMCNVCRDLGYIGALADEYYHDSTGRDIADEITTYITELFNAIRESEVKE